MGPPNYAAMAERLWPRALDLLFGGAAAAVALLALLCAAAFVVEAVAEARALRTLGVRTRPWLEVLRAMRARSSDTLGPADDSDVGPRPLPGAVVDAETIIAGGVR